MGLVIIVLKSIALVAAALVAFVSLAFGMGVELFVANHANECEGFVSIACTFPIL